MIKQLSLCKRRPDISHEECVRLHRDIHMPLVKRLLGHGIGKYMAHYVDDSVAQMSTKWTQLSPQCDIIVELWWEDDTWNSLSAYFKTPEGKQIPEDEKNWLDQESLITFVVHQYQII